MAKREDQVKAEREEALLEEGIRIDTESLAALRLLTAKNAELAKNAAESHQTNLELVSLAKAEGDERAAQELQVAAFGDLIKSQTMVQIATLDDTNAARVADRLQSKQDKMDAKEVAKEAEANKSVGEKFADGKKEIGGPIKAPSFLMKLAKLALGIVGVKVFSVMIKNFDSIKKFVKEKILPATEGIFTFFKETVFPFISNNFKEIMNGFVLLSGAFLAGFVFIKIINAVKIVRAGLLALQLGMIATGKGLMSMVTGVLSKLGTAVKFLRAGYLAITVFTMGTLVPALMTAVASMSFALAPFLPIIIGVGLAIAGIALLLNKVKNALGFDSVFDVMLLGVEHMKDGLAVVGNFFIKIAQKLAGLGGGLLEKLGIKVPDFVKNLENAELMDTNGAEKFKASVYEKQEKVKAERLSKGEVGTSEIPELPVAQKVSQSEIPELTVKVSKINTEEKESQLSTIPTIPMERSGRSGRKLEALSTGRNDVENMSASGGGNLAVQNISAPTTTNNSQSSAVYGDASPATDDLDRVAFG